MKRKPTVLKQLSKSRWATKPILIAIGVFVLICIGASAFVVNHINSKAKNSKLTTSEATSGDGSIPLGIQGDTCPVTAQIQTSPTIQGENTNTSANDSTNCSITTAPKVVAKPNQQVSYSPTSTNSTSPAPQTQQQANEAACTQNESGYVSLLLSEYSLDSEITRDQVNSAISSSNVTLVGTTQALNEANKAITDGNSSYTSYYNAYLGEEKPLNCTPTIGPPLQIVECANIEECAATIYPN